MALSQISWLLLVLQIGLFLCTALLGPMFLRPRWIMYLLYTIAAALLWLGYTMVAMLFNSKVDLDVPGVGYLFIGLIGWAIGSTIYLIRIRR